MFFFYLCAPSSRDNKTRLMARRLRLIFIFSLAAIFCCGCSGLKEKVQDIKITSVAVDSFNLKGLRSIETTLALTVDNPVIAFTLTDIEGSLFYKGDEFIIFSADRLKVKGKRVAQYPLDAEASLAESVSLVNVLGLLSSYSLSKFTVSVSAKVKVLGISKTLKFTEIPVKDLI